MMALALTAVAFALGTWGFGWGAVAVIGAVVGLAQVSERPVRTAAAGAGLAWGGLLLWGALTGPLPALAGVLGGIVGLPSVAVVVLTLVFAMAVAGAAAGAGAAVRELVG
jgi:hypothetical protein